MRQWGIPPGIACSLNHAGGTPRFQSHNFLTGEGVDIFFCFSLVFKGAFCIAFVIGFQRELLFVSRRYGVDQLFFREL